MIQQMRNYVPHQARRMRSSYFQAPVSREKWSLDLIDGEYIRFDLKQDERGTYSLSIYHTSTGRTQTTAFKHHANIETLKRVITGDFAASHTHDIEMGRALANFDGTFDDE